MLVREGERICVSAPAKAEAAPDAITADYYASLPQIQLSPDRIRDPSRPHPPIEVLLDGNEVGRLVECAIRHPRPNMRNAVLAAIWNHPETFRQILQFGLNAPEAFGEIRNLVAEELAKTAPAREAAASDETRTLLPRMPLPAHLRDRGKQRS
jgi:hypothetical protein